VYNNLTAPILSNFNLTYKYNFQTSGTINGGQTLTQSTPFTGTLEFPEKIQ
jgi:hypothetical protein